MASFDPAAATAAYLAQLPPEAHAKATAYTQGGHWLLLWNAVILVAVAWIILRTGLLTRIARRIERNKPRPFLAGFLCGLVFIALQYVLTLPWALYADWWREKSYGLNNQTWSAWLGEAAMVSAISMVLMALFIGLIYVLLRRAPKTRLLWAGGLTAAFIAFLLLLQPILIAPMLNKYTPAPPGPVRDAVVQMARANDVPSDKIFIYNGSKQSSRYTANVSGLFGTARIAMSDAMFQKGADLSEVKGVVGHEMGHYVHMDSIWLTIGFSLLLMVLYGLMARLFMPAAGLMGASGVESIADPAGLPVLMALFAVLQLLASPIANTMIRTVEARADQFSVEHFHEPDGLARALVKTIEYRAATPGKLEEVLFYDHPAVGNRIRRLMDWKAAHMNEAPTTPAS